MGDELKERFGEQYRIDSAQLLSSTKSFEDEVALDGLISAAKNATADDYKAFFDVGLNTLVDDIRNDLEGFGVSYDEWFSER